MYKKALTLVEIVVVVMILGILAAIALPRYDYITHAQSVNIESVRQTFNTNFLVQRMKFLNYGITSKAFNIDNPSEATTQSFTFQTSDYQVVKISSPAFSGVSDCALMLQFFGFIKAADSTNTDIWQITLTNSGLTAQCRFEYVEASQYFEYDNATGAVGLLVST